MSAGGNSVFSDFDDDDILDVTPQIRAASDGSSSDAPRPPKRRRLNVHNSKADETPSSPGNTQDTQDTQDTQEEGYDGRYSGESDGSKAERLPSRSKEVRRSKEVEHQKPPSKYKFFQPKYRIAEEITFVTQLTQPHSSPSRIRGPRWKKPDPEPVVPKVAPSPPAAAKNQKPDQPDEYDEDDDDMKAAIAASLESFRGEGQPDRIRQRNGTNETRTTAMSNSSFGVPASASFGSAFDIGDIPEDAFDSSTESCPSVVEQEPIPISSQAIPTQRSFQRQGSFQNNLRQTTLFGGTVQEKPSSQSFSRGWPLASQNEPPTHHKLDSHALTTWVYPRNLGEKRDYQFNIAQKGLFHNLLVALPTGLGKTFIAATVMLNWFRWTVNAQIVFVAPTKPLVSQQVAACFNIVGIPRSVTTMLTGNTPPGLRAEEWQHKRVFFMTPQTLINDLKTGIADPKRIVLLVIDEAHRATGAYAYVEAVKFLQRFNSSFRVLALTATPGATVEAVQEVIDGLSIARVEIRTEKSLDIREFVHARSIEIETFENSEEMAMCMDLFAKALQPAVDKLRTINAYWGRDPMALTPYGLTVARKQWMSSDAGRNSNQGIKGMVNSIFTLLASLAHSIDLLKFHGIGPFYRSLLSFQSSVAESRSKWRTQIANDASFKTLMNRVRGWTNNDNFIGHPKLHYLKQVVLNHLMDSDSGAGSAAGLPSADTRIMIFAHFRDSAEEIVRVLRRQPMIRPHVFVGQANAKGSEGMDQKTQLDIIEKFKKGTYNTIVATSIGEEGLDIGEVDLIVCYDSSASPIRMLQRMGRTGRKRKGRIVLLLMKGKEEDSYTKATDNYEKMQQLIASGARFTFHDEISRRILPKEVRPTVDERQIEIPIENSQAELPEPTRRGRGRAPKRPPKKFHMPDDVETGFTKASNLGSKRKKKLGRDSEAGIITPPPPPISDPVEIPPLDDVVLSSTEQRELERRYCNIGGTSPQFVRRPQVDKFPELQRSYRPVKLVKHGRVTHRLVKTFRQMNSMSSDCESRFKAHLHPEDIKEADTNRSDIEKRNARRAELQQEPSLFCTQSSREQPRGDLPILSSQISIPDINTLISKVYNTQPDTIFEERGHHEDVAPKPSQRRRRLVIDDDSDDFDI
ncbi:hypothetical protein AJ80_02694 [Polytolypa hystricis UAMH7299]|uniref:ATP-dependent DNA helicase n=1 Tax=Polytolypa hystricis (strain UAMH7299) TaxID=1447883 RepID=A0A2B7YQW3_POLH7|nr:hypothetical protein AJ80_02694 [Polytolypa hystricis UAMH7299]